MRDEDKSREQLIRELLELRQNAADCAEGEIGDFVKEKSLEESVCRSEAELSSASSRMLLVQEEERKRIARELHDSLGSLLTAIKISLENAQNLMRMSGADPAFLENPIYLTQLSIQEVRTMISGLRPSVLDDLGLIAAINWLCRQMATCSNISMEKTIGVEESQIPEGLKIVIFRVLQEAIHNITKYSKTNMVELEFITTENVLELTLRDHGVGFDVGNALAEDNSGKGLGLTMMRERTESSGGSFSIISVSGEGTTIRATWPKSIKCRRSQNKLYVADTQFPRKEIR